MAEYLKRDDVLTNSEILTVDTRDYGRIDVVPVEYLADIPSADVQPVKRGFWKALMMSEETGWDLSLTGGHDTVCEYVCSVCGKPNIVDEFGDSYLPNFCPNCGARMIKDGERK